MKRFLTLISILTTITLAGVIRDGSMQASSNGNEVIIKWGSTDESTLKVYEIERRSGTSGEFNSIESIQKKGSYSDYQYIDKSAFKTTGTIYYYRIKMIYNNNNVEYSLEKRVEHNVSSVKRTWGSLKAMFR